MPRRAELRKNRLTAVTVTHRPKFLSVIAARRRQPLPRARLRVRVADDVIYHGSHVCAGVDHSRQSLHCQTADRNQWCVADAAFPLANALQTLRRPGHHFEDGRIDRAECDVVVFEFERPSELEMTVCAYSDLHARLAYGGDIRGVQVALP